MWTNTGDFRIAFGFLSLKWQQKQIRPNVIFGTDIEITEYQWKTLRRL